MAKGDVIDVLIAEAIGEGDEGLAAVAWTIMNRAAETGRTPAQVVSDPGDYTGASNPGSATKKAMKDPAIRAKVEKVWSQVQSGSIPDPTGGATHYWAPNGMKGGKAPYWAKSETSDAGRLKIGNHVFLPKQSPNSALSAINAAAPTPMPARPPTLSAFASTPTLDPMRSLQDALNAKAERIRAGTDTPVAQKAIVTPPVPRVPGFVAPSMADTRREAFRPVAPARGVGTPNLTARTVRTVPIDPLTGTPVTAQAPAPRPVSKPPNVTYVPSTPAPTPFQTANRTMVQGLPIVGPIVTGMGAAADLVQRVAPATAQAKPAPQPTRLPSVIPPTPKGYNTLTGKYETMQPSTPYVAGPAPVRTADKAYTSRIYPVANAPTMQEARDEQAMMRRPRVPQLAPATLPRLPMPKPAALSRPVVPVRTAPIPAARIPLPQARTVNPVSQIIPAVQARAGQGIFGQLFNMLTAGNVPQANTVQRTASAPQQYATPLPGQAPNLIAGVDIAFMPKAVQQSDRWREAAGL